MHEIHIQQRFSAPPQRVFAAVTDHRGMEKWLNGARVTLEKEGQPPPNGLGALRKVTARGVSVYEEVVRWEEPRAMDYRVVRGGPIRNHLGEIRLEPASGGGTALDYRIRFTIPWYLGGALLGSFIAKQLHAEIGKGLAKLAAQLGG